MIEPRRAFLKRSAAVALGFHGLAAALSRSTHAGVLLPDRPGYGPLVPDRVGLFDLPEGFAYDVISRTGEIMSDGLYVPARHDGMAAFPGPDGLTILVRNHEIEDRHRALGPFGRHNQLLNKIDPARLYDPGQDNVPSQGGTTTIVYDTRAGEEPGRLVSHFLSLAGTERNCAGGPTPRNTWISCEESVLPRGADNAARDHGWCFEVPATAEPNLTPAEPIKPMGRFFHEACATNPASGVVYLTEDRQDGVLYRYLPNDPDRLREGGRLQALAIADNPSADLRNWADPNAVTPRTPLPTRWIDLEDIESPDDSLRYQAFQRGAARLSRGEGMWWGNDACYLACTDGGAARVGQIFRYTPPHPEIEGTPAENDHPGTIELFYESPNPGVLENADNITVAPWGDLIVCEDGRGVQKLLGITPAGRVYTLGRNAMNQYELAGATFSPDGSTLFVNLQIPGMTLAIRGPWRTR